MTHRICLNPDCTTPFCPGCTSDGWPVPPRSLASESDYCRELADALRTLLADVDHGSLILDHSDRRETERDIAAARALLDGGDR